MTSCAAFVSKFMAGCFLYDSDVQQKTGELDLGSVQEVLLVRSEVRVILVGRGTRRLAARLGVCRRRRASLWMPSECLLVM